MKEQLITLLKDLNFVEFDKCWILTNKNTIYTITMLIDYDYTKIKIETFKNDDKYPSVVILEDIKGGLSAISYIKYTFITLKRKEKIAKLLDS